MTNEINSMNTNHTINQERLAQTFMDLVRIDSVSGEEGRCCRDLQRRLTDLGLEIFIDDAHVPVHGDTGNLIARLPGRRPGDPLLLSAHMDTVEPGRGIVPRLVDGVFSSDGTTILGADDKSALAVILEVLNCIQEAQLPCPPLEVVFSVCEETGLLGATHLDFSKITAHMGYVLDSGDPEVLITHAPCAERITFTLHGRAAHAGSCPETGINAIALAAKAIAGIRQARIDGETTCNIGLIQGGLATNIVPAKVVVQAEARSHDEAKLESIIREMAAAFEAAVASHPAVDGVRPRLEIEQEREFDRLSIDSGHPTVAIARQAAQHIGMTLVEGASGGGSDASVFAAHGIVTAVLGTGMEKVHSTEETIRLDAMVGSARLLLEIISLYGI